MGSHLPPLVVGEGLGVRVRVMEEEH